MVETQVRASSRASLPANITPKTREPWGAWGSYIDWPNLHQILVEELRGSRLRCYVPVYCGICGKTRDVPLLNGLTSNDMLSADSLRRTGKGAHAGLCRSCWSKTFRRNETLPDGSEPLWMERGPEGLPVVCGDCGKRPVFNCEGAATVRDFLAALLGATWGCRCGHKIGVIRHPSGARLHWLRRKYRLGKDEFKVAYICRRCGSEDYVFTHNLRDGWRGLCPLCRQIEGDPKAITGDMSLVETRSCILYSQRDGDAVPVLCGLPGCGKTNVFSFGGTRLDTFTGYCRKHPRREISAALRAFAQSAASRVEVKRPVGRQKGEKLNDYDAFAEEVKAAVMKVWLRVGKLAMAVEQADVIAELRGHTISAATLRWRLGEAGYRIKWKLFVELVVRELTAN